MTEQNQTIKIETTVAAKPAIVWQRWTRPEHITQWNFASDDWQCPEAEIDLRVGGKYRARMEAKDGSFGFDFEAVYDEVVDRKRVALKLSDGRRASTDFEDLGEATKITTVFDADGEHSIEMQRDGWQAILDNFKQYVENASR